MCDHCYHVIWRNSETSKQGMKCCHCGDYYREIRTSSFEVEYNLDASKRHGLFVERKHRYHEAQPKKSRNFY